MRSFIGYFIRYPVAGNTLLIMILVFGLFSLFQLKSTFFPPQESQIILIQTVYPGSSPDEIEKTIVLKIEENLEGMVGVDKVTSVSQENSGTVTVEVSDDYDTDIVLQDVKNAVDRISDFPDAMEPPSIFKRENIDQAISFAIAGPVDLLTLKQISRDAEDDLRSIDGISQIELSGFPEEEIEIAIREADLEKYNLTSAMIARAVAANNLELTGGKIKGEREDILIRADYKEYHAGKIGELIIRSGPEGELLRLKDVADVRNRWEDSPNRSYLNGNPSVVVDVKHTIYEDILSITDSVKNYIGRFNKSHDNVQATVIRDRSETLQGRIGLLAENGLVGLILVLVLLTLFLNIRLAFWVGLSIPISILGMIIVALVYGVTVNVMSLFGTIIVIGILVDDGIVISENIYQHWERGKPRLKAAIDGTMEVLPAVFSAILTTAIAFSTFFFLAGRVGDFATDLAFVVIFTLAFSLVEGALILPGHVGHSEALNKERKPWILERYMRRFMDFLKNKVYGPALRFTVEYPLIMIAIFVACLILTIGGVRGGFIKTTFFPNIERDEIAVKVTMPAGTNDRITQKWLEHIQTNAWIADSILVEEYGMDTSLIQNIEMNIGPNSHDGSLNLILLTSELREDKDGNKINSYAVANKVREMAGPIPNAENVSYGGGTPFGLPVSVSLLSEDKAQLEKAKDLLKEELNNLSSLKDVVDNDQQGLTEVSVKLKQKAWMLGLNPLEIMRQVRQGFFGNEVQRLQRGLDEVKVWVRYDSLARNSIADLENMEIRLEDGREIPLEQLATFSKKRGVLLINHLNGERVVKVEADIADPGVSATDMNTYIETDLLPPILAKYPAVDFVFQGQAEQSAKTGQSAGKTMPIILGLMLATIILTFRSFSQSLLIFLSLPFGLIGVGLGHLIQGEPVSLLSFFGIIALIGIMVNDSLVLVTAFNNNLKSGMKFREAVYETGLSRFRPILLTSVTTVAGLAPLMLETSLQAQFLIPMAISVSYGLGIATFVTLLLLPGFIMLINRIKFLSKWFWEGEKPESEREVEPAVKEMKYEQEEI